MEGPGGGVTGQGGACGRSRGRRACCGKVKQCWEHTGGHAAGSSLRLRPAGMLNLAALLWRRLLRKRWVLALVFGLSLVYFLSSTFKQVSDCTQDLCPSDLPPPALLPIFVLLILLLSILQPSLFPSSSVLLPLI